MGLRFKRLSKLLYPRTAHQEHAVLPDLRLDIQIVEIAPHIMRI